MPQKLTAINYDPFFALGNNWPLWNYKRIRSLQWHCPANFAMSLSEKNCHFKCRGVINKYWLLYRRIIKDLTKNAEIFFYFALRVSKQCSCFLKQGCMRRILVTTAGFYCVKSCIKLKKNWTLYWLLKISATTCCNIFTAHYLHTLWFREQVKHTSFYPKSTGFARSVISTPTCCAVL